jgi:phage tail sheath protein FI
MTFSRPGTYINETLTAAQVASGSNAGITQAFVGALPRGPVGPTQVNSWSDFNRYFGGFLTTVTMPIPTVAHAVYQYFNSGGRTAWVVRALGATAKAATRIANVVRAATPAIDFTANSAGLWGNNVYVEILAGSDPTVQSVIVRNVPTGATPTDAMVVERWTDVSLDPTSSRYLLAMLNNPSGAGSDWLTPAVHTGYVFTTGDVLVTSLVAGGDPITTGADGSVPSSAQLIAAVSALDVVTDPIDLNLPGITDAATLNPVISYCDPLLGGRGDVFLIVDCQPARSAAQLVTDQATFTDSSYAAMYAPMQWVPDPSSNVPGSSRLVPPGSMAAGQYAYTDAVRGVFKAPAGVGARLPVLDVETRFKNSELDSLNVAGINVIRPVPGNGICIFGSRTFKPSPADKYIPIRRSLITIESRLRQATLFAVFEPNDDVLWGHVQSVCERILRDFWTAGGLRGDSPDTAYYAICSDENNTDQTIAAGEVHIDCGVSLQYPAEFVVISIGQFEGGTSITDTAA